MTTGFWSTDYLLTELCRAMDSTGWHRNEGLKALSLCSRRVSEAAGKELWSKVGGVRGLLKFLDCTESTGFTVVRNMRAIYNLSVLTLLRISNG